ncbi:hypothetical protein BGZ60DRAFT_534688 [Tricladium varicosporioides]|nr:hypothetical protein BGZ60DRAFT_534688 [Hymenoscyphus varicosporioides]
MYSPVALTLLSVLSSAASVQAIVAWTVNCGVLSIQRSDPIVNPGGPSGHVHAISGGTAFQRLMPGADTTINAKQTTCDKFTDRSNYWAPQLYHQKNGMFELVPYTGVNSYYKNYTCSYNPNAKYCPTPTDARAFPPGLRMLAGDPLRRTYDASIQSNQAILWETGNTGEKPGFPTGPLADRIQANIRFPSCWDGVNIDSPDHKSHVAYPDPAKGDTAGGMCPESHPVALISIGAEFGFSTQQAGLTGQSASTLVLSNGDTTGYGAHADFIQGWQNSEALENSFANCNGIGSACAWNSFGTPDGTMGTKKDLVPEVAPPVEEEIGLNGPIAKLPGNNPVYTPGMTYSTPAATGSLVPVSSGAAAPSAASSSHAAGAVSSAGGSSTAIIKTLPPTTLQTVASSSGTASSSIIKTLPPTTLVTSAKVIKTGAPTTLQTKAAASPSTAPALGNGHNHNDDDDDDACAPKF